MDKPTIPILSTTGPIRKFEVHERFANLFHDTYEIFQCDDTSGSFVQIANALMSLDDAETALGMIIKADKETNGKASKFFICRVERSPIEGNFNPRVVIMQSEGTRQ